MTVSVPSVNSAYSAESTDGTLTNSATKAVFFFFQYLNYTYLHQINTAPAGAAVAVFRDTPKGKWVVQVKETTILAE